MRAAGFDNISTTKAVGTLTNIIHTMMRLRDFPKKWKYAEVIMLSKAAKDTTFPQIYRLISLLPAMSKIVERVIAQEQREDLKNIPREQFRFRLGYSTEHQVLHLVVYVADRKGRKLKTGIIFLGVAKLIYKMDQPGYPNSIVQLMDSYIRQRQCRVRVFYDYSNYRTLAAGLPQGAVIALQLHEIYAAGIRNQDPTDRTILAMYADHTGLNFQTWTTDVK